MKRHFSSTTTMSSCEVTSSSFIGWVMRTFLLGVFTFLSVNVTLHGQCQTCCNGSKPKTLVFTYVGGSCGDTKTCQAAGKWACTGGGTVGATTVYITVSKNADGSGGTYFAGTVSLNADFTVNSASGGSSTFPSNTYFNIYSNQGGTPLQRLQIHTSCSTPLVAGDQFGALFLKKIILADNTNCNAPTPPGPPEECPTPVITINNTTPTNVGELCKGDQIIFKTTDTGYPCIAYAWNFGANATPATATGIGPHTVTYAAAGTATVSLTIDNDCEGGVGTTVCPPPPPPPVGGDCCDSNSGKPKSLKLKYTGGGCSATNTSQGTDKYSCTDSGGGPNNAATVYVVASESATGGIIYFSGNVSLNQSFSVTSPSSTLPTNTYLTISSSQGGTVLQKLKIHTSCSAPIVPGEQFGSMLLESATWSTGATCDINNSGSGGGSGEADCCDSNDGKPKSITMQYTGQGCSASNTSQSTSKYSCAESGGGPNNASTVYIIASETATGGVVYFSGNVSLGGTFTATSPSSSLPTNTYFRIFSSQGGTLLQSVKIHTSCSAPLVPGDQFGSLKLLAATWASGATCGSVTPPGPNCIDCDKTVSVNITIEDCQPLGSIGDRVWEDLNANGVQDQGEPGVSGVVVLLKDCNNNVIGGTTTDANGNYNFPNLAAGCYRVGIVPPSDYLISPQNAGNNDAVDSDVDPVMFMTDDITLDPGENDPTNDAGIYLTPPQPAALGDFVWNDLNQNGIQDAGEQGVANVTVRLYRCDGTFLSSTTTNNVGFYQFTNLTPNAQYFVEFSNLPAGFQFTTRNAQNNTQDNIDSDANPSDGRTDCTFLSPGEVDNTLDAGVYQPTPILGSLGDFVWNDLDNDGFQDANEPGIGGVTVRLKNCNNAVLAVTTTNNAGFYTFNNLAAGCYRVEVVLPTGFVFSPANAGGDDTKDSDIDPNTAMTADIDLSQGENDPTNDAGIYQPTQPPGSIGDKVWNDQNQNGLQDPSEPGVPGVTVRLLDCNGNVIATTTTNANGIYTFNNLPGGNYIVEFVLPAGYQRSQKDAGNDSLDSDADPNTGRTDCFPLAPGQNDPTRDAGIYQPTQEPACVGDFVWKDMNSNGIQDAGEPGVQGVIVKLFTCTGTYIGQFTTNANGYYKFINLIPGSYFLQFSNLPAGFMFTTQDAGVNDAVDSDADPTTGNTACFTLTPGQTDLTRDAGLKPIPTTGPATIGDYVWFDTNANGIQDAGEPGIPGVFVILETCTGAFVDFKVTDAQGLYLFTNVAPGQYRVKFANPGNYNGVPIQLTIKDAGNDDSKDSDADWLGFTNCITVNAGETNLTIDAGFTGETPPPVCVINGSVSNIVCSDNGTTNNPGDDTYTFTIIVNGTNTGEWGYDIPAVGLFMAQYGQPYNLGPFNISAGTLTLLINDHDVADCKTTVSVTPPAPCSVPVNVCDNVTHGGTIGYDETSCVGFDPAPIVSLSLPSGGSGAIEYIWLQSTLGCPDNLSQAIPGATGPTYDPPFINQTTWFIRCARRVGCTQYIESNCIKKEVCTSGGGCNVTIAGGSNSITIAGLNAPNVDVKVFNANWQMVFNCFNNCNNPQIVTSLPAGTYYVDVQMWNANWQPICNKSQYVTVTNLTGSNGGINLVTPGNDDGEEDAESVVNDRSSESHEMVIPVESLDVRLYPNPANAFVTLDLESMMGQEVQIELLDNLGRKIQRIEIDEVTTALHRIELNELKEGYYMVWVKTPGSKPVVKQLIVAKR